MERYKEIERSIIKKYRKEIWSKFIKAVKEYELIKENDKVHSFSSSFSIPLILSGKIFLFCH